MDVTMTAVMDAIMGAVMISATDAAAIMVLKMTVAAQIPDIFS